MPLYNPPTAGDPEGTAAAAITSHEGATNPHSQYALSGNLGTAAAASTDDFDQAGAAAAAIASHEGATNPHSQYVTSSDLSNIGGLVFVNAPDSFTEADLSTTGLNYTLSGLPSSGNYMALVSFRGGYATLNAFAHYIFEYPSKTSKRVPSPPSKASWSVGGVIADYSAQYHQSLGLVADFRQLFIPVEAGEVWIRRSAHTPSTGSTLRVIAYIPVTGGFN